MLQWGRRLVAGWSSRRAVAVVASGGGRRNEATLPGKVDVVVCGGGVVGTSVAFHLSKLGWSDVVVLEQGRCDVTDHVLFVVFKTRLSDWMR